MQLDEINLAILGILRDDSRTPISHIAQMLGISRTSVAKRIERLENTGVIVGYTITTKTVHERHLVQGVMQIRVEGTKIQAVTRALQLELGIQKIYSTNGKWDLLVELKADGLEKFDQTLDRIRNIQGVASSETSILLSSYKA